MSAYFIAGTGTGIGKTFTTCALVAAARAKGMEVRGLKPVLSGYDANDATNDAAQIIEAAGNTQNIDDVSPWRFREPLSPHRAAMMESRTIDFDALVTWTKQEANRDGVTYIETVGGVMVPLNNAKMVLDWMAAVDLPVIFVTGSYLGTISHTLTALGMLRGKGIRVEALIMNESDGSSVTLAEAMEGLRPFIADIPLQIAQPRVSSWQEAHALHAML